MMQSKPKPSYRKPGAPVIQFTVGLLINWSGNFTITLGFLIETFGEVEASITAIERVDAMSRLPQEKSMVTDEAYKVPPSWPEHGNVEFDNVCLRYREGLPLALNNLSFTIPAGKRCGVVGRTGAGTCLGFLIWIAFGICPLFLL